MPDMQPTERFDSFYDEETKLVKADGALPSQQVELLEQLANEVRRMSLDFERVVGALNAARSDINRIDQQLAQVSIETRTMGMTLKGIDGPVREIQTHLRALGAKLQGMP